MTSPPDAGRCPLCGATAFEEVFSYNEPPEGETRFDLPPGQAYERAYLRCGACGHFLQVTDIDLDAALYSGAYVDATYRDLDGMKATFARIMALPVERSDNAARVDRVDRMARERGVATTLLDVGSGLGVFPARMRERGWDCTVVDPDQRAVAFATDELGLDGICGDFMTVVPPRQYGLVTFNKVLEHVSDPVAMLARTRAYLQSGGLVYVEVPDGEAAATDPDGPGREEFFVEHLHVFSPRSLELLADGAGFDALVTSRLREPSGKYTLFAFLA